MLFTLGPRHVYRVQVIHFKKVEAQDYSRHTFFKIHGLKKKLYFLNLTPIFDYQIKIVLLNIIRKKIGDPLVNRIEKFKYLGSNVQENEGTMEVVTGEIRFDVGCSEGRKGNETTLPQALFRKISKIQIG